MTDFKDPALADYLAVAARLPDEHINVDGSPNVRALNAALNEAGFRDISARERDAFQATLEEQHVAPKGVADLPGPKTGTTRICIVDAMANPLPLYIYGVGQFSLRVGEKYDLPQDAISALENASGVTFTKIEDR